MRKEAVLLVTLLVCAGLSRAEPITIKVKPYPSKGKSFTVKTVDQLDATQTEEEKGKPAQTQKSTALRAETYTQTTLEVIEGKLSAFQRAYTSSTIESGGKVEKSPLDGHTISFKLEKGGSKHDLKEKLAPEEDKKLNEAHADGLVVILGLLPTKAVSEGDEWALTGKQIVSGLVSIPVDAERSKGKGKLVKVTKVGETPIGTLEFEIDLETIAGAEGVGKGKFVILAEAALDGSTTRGKVTIKGSITLEADQKGTKTRIVAGGEFTAEISEEK